MNWNLKKYFSKDTVISAPEKNLVALPDPIHNTCVWAAKKKHPQASNFQNKSLKKVKRLKIYTHWLRLSLRLKWSMWSIHDMVMDHLLWRCGSRLTAASPNACRPQSLSFNIKLPCLSDLSDLELKFNSCLSFFSISITYLWYFINLIYR